MWFYGDEDMDKQLHKIMWDAIIHLYPIPMVVHV